MLGSDHVTEYDELLDLRAQLRNITDKVARLRAALPKPVTWTDRKPDRPGWWWRRRRGMTDRVEEVIDSHGRLIVVDREGVGMLVDKMIGRWSSEPCEPPKEPTE